MVLGSFGLAVIFEVFSSDARIRGPVTLQLRRAKSTGKHRPEGKPRAQKWTGNCYETCANVCLSTGS